MIDFFKPVIIELTNEKRPREIDVETIRSWKPCYDPEKHLSPNEKYTVLSILDRKDISFEDRLWAIMRPELVSEKLMRLFAVWCVRQVQHLMRDERSINAINVAERFANGQATKDELDSARDAAWAAAWDAAWAAAWDAARDSAWAAARASARDAQENKLREMLIAGIETGDTK